MEDWIKNYLADQGKTIAAIPPADVARIIGILRKALDEDRQVFAFGNGGSASNASHFATDLGKGASDKLGKRFRVMSLNDNVSWLTAIGNDYAYEDVFVRQLMNYAKTGDVALALSVSGNSPNVVKAIRWAKENGLTTVALVGAKKGELGKIADHVIAAASEHYGRAEDAQMIICHMLCYAFMENAGG